MKIIVGGCAGEIHTFLTARSNFKPILGNDIYKIFKGTKTSIGGFIKVAEREGIDLVYTVYSSVGAAPTPTNESYQLVKKEILERILSVGHIDGVLLAMHGALVVEGVPNGAEADFIGAIRDLIGTDIPIICTADMHANVSERWVELVDAIFGYNSTPHVDTYERGVEAAEAMISTINGEIRPVMAIKKPGILTPTGLQLVNYPGERGPLPKVFKKAFEWEKKTEIINVNVFCGYDRADRENVGASIVVVADNNFNIASIAVEDIAKVFWEVRDEFWLDYKQPEEAVKMAVESKEWPVVLHDGEDDPGGGATCDGTQILKTMIEMEIDDAAIWLHDADAVNKAFDAGVGETVTMKVGGKLVWREDRKHALPLEITGKIKILSDGVFKLRGPVSTGTIADMGRSAVIDINGIELVLSENRRAPTSDPTLYRSVGIEPIDKKIIVVKQKHHWRAAYEPIVKKIISVHCPLDYSVSTYSSIDPLTGKQSWPYKKIKRPIWPLDRDTSMW